MNTDDKRSKMKNCATIRHFKETRNTQKPHIRLLKSQLATEINFPVKTRHKKQRKLKPQSCSECGADRVTDYSSFV